MYYIFINGSFNFLVHEWVVNLETILKTKSLKWLEPHIINEVQKHCFETTLKIDDHEFKKRFPTQVSWIFW